MVRDNKRYSHTMRKLITRQYLKNLLTQRDQDLSENLNLQGIFSSKVHLEKDEEKRREALGTLAELEDIQSLIRGEIEGITDLLDLGIIDIIIEEK